MLHDVPKHVRKSWLPAGSEAVRRRHSDYVNIAEVVKQHLHTGHDDKAMEVWERFIDNADSHNAGQALNQMGDILARQKNVVEAVVRYYQAAREFELSGYQPKAVASLKKIIKIDPDRVEVYRQVAELNARCDRVGDAVESYLKYARHMVRMGKPEMALPVFARIRILDPVNTRHRLQLAAELFEAGLIDAAAEEILAAVELLMESGRLEEAANRLNELAERHPNYPKIAPMRERLTNPGGGEDGGAGEDGGSDDFLVPDQSLHPESGGWHRPLGA